MNYKYPLIVDESIEAVKNGIRNAREINWDSLIALKRKLVDFYENDQTSGEYLGRYGFYDKDRKKYFDDLPFISVSLTKKIINRISLCYKEPPERTVLNSNGNPIEDDSYNQMINEHPNFNLAMTNLERYFNLLENVLFRPVFDPEGNQFLFYIETEYIPYFGKYNPLFPIAYDIPIKQDPLNKFASGDQVYLFVSDKYYFYHLADSEVPILDPNLDSIENPYGICPIVDFSRFPVEQYWSLGKKDIVEANQMMNVMFMNGMYGFHFQSFNQPYITGANKNDVNDIQLGPNRITLIDANSTMGLLQYSVNFTGMAEWIKFYLNSVLQNYGILAHWDDTGGIASGISLKIKNIELLENRQESAKFFRTKESELYEVMKTMINYHSVQLGYKPLPQDSKVNVDFYDIEFPTDPAEKRAEYDWLFRNNLASKIDYIKEMNPDLNDEAAIRRYEKIIAENRKLIGLGEPGATATAILEGIE